jgi:signal transduction histidine kinase
VVEFEHYASEVYLSAGITSFGTWSYPNSSVRGIASVDASGLFHDTMGNPNSTNDYLAPIIHFTGTTQRASAAGSVLFNINYEPLRLDAIGDAVQCFEEALAAGNSTMHCQRITDFVVPQLNFEIAPAAMMVHPVSIQGSLKALVFSTQYWGDLIDFSIPAYVSGLVVVVSTESNSFTYNVVDGGTSVPVEGDFHSHDSSRHSFIADIQGKDGIYYTVSIYASDTYYAGFEDNRAVYACIIGVVIAVMMVGLFFLYDYFLSRSAREHAVILATKRAFVRYISHEIRTPLNTVNIGLKVLMQELGSLTALIAATSSFASTATSSSSSTPCSETDAPTPPSPAHCTSEALIDEKQRDLLALVLEIEDSSDTAVGILNDLINYDKISMNNMNLELQVLDVWQLLRESYEPFLMQARQKNLRMTLVLDCDDEEEAPGVAGGVGDHESVRAVRIIGDSVKLKQVLRNLLSNALKFTPHHGNIEVSGRWLRDEMSLTHPSTELPLPVTCTPAGALRISVKDSGAGISPENQAELFQEGRQFNANRRAAGWGCSSRRAW